MVKLSYFQVVKLHLSHNEMNFLWEIKRKWRRNKWNNFSSSHSVLLDFRRFNEKRKILKSIRLAENDSWLYLFTSKWPKTNGQESTFIPFHCSFAASSAKICKLSVNFRRNKFPMMTRIGCRTFYVKTTVVRGASRKKILFSVDDDRSTWWSSADTNWKWCVHVKTFHPLDELFIACYCNQRDINEVD